MRKQIREVAYRMQTIVTTAIPRITDEFHSLDQVGWYGSAFFLTLASFQSTWGKLYKYFALKPVFLASVFVFEVGSLMCGERCGIGYSIIEPLLMFTRRCQREHYSCGGTSRYRLRSGRCGKRLLHYHCVHCFTQETTCIYRDHWSSFWLRKRRRASPWRSIYR